MSRQRQIFITGGAGFIGANLAQHFLSLKDAVSILDNFSRPGVAANAKWLLKEFPRLEVVDGSIGDFTLLKRLIKTADVIFHLAGQTAVTTSLENPRADFEANALGTFNILEAARLAGHKPIVIYASTNKVYGKFKQQLVEKKTRYEDKLHPHGVSEDEPLSFHSPYGCSKGAADQYTLDYARIYGLPTVVLRQSCIYGQRQFGIAGQGWIAYLTSLAVYGEPMTIYGTGKQVRDVLYIDDLVKLYEKILLRIDRVKGEVFNVGGGVEQTISLLELVALLEKKLGKKLRLSYQEARPGDQEVYVSCIDKAKRLLGWEPNVGIEQGLERLIDWVKTILH